MAYDSISLPMRTRHELPFSIDMYDFGNRLNIHGQRKIVEPDVTLLWDKEKPTKEDVISLGWRGMNTTDKLQEKGFMACVCRGLCDDIDEITKVLSYGDIVTER
jgi:hypothetical protein